MPSASAMRGAATRLAQMLASPGYQRSIQTVFFSRTPPKDYDGEIKDFDNDKLRIDLPEQILSEYFTYLVINGMRIDIRLIQGLWNGYNFVRPKARFCKTLGNVVYIPRRVELKKDEDILNKLKGDNDGKIIYIERKPYFIWDDCKRIIYY